MALDLRKAAVRELRAIVTGDWDIDLDNDQLQDEDDAEERKMKNQRKRQRANRFLGWAGQLALSNTNMS